MDAAPGGARHRLDHCSRRLVFVAALLTSLVLATGAEAATIGLGGKAITYSAGQGEENHVTVRTGPTEMRVDDVVPITAGAGCSAHPTAEGWTASCTSADGGWINLFDGADELTFDPASEAAAHATLVNGGEGDDRLVAGPQPAVVYGDSGDDELIGGDAFDDLHGDDGDDVLRGNAGADTLDGGTGADRLTGGAGYDTFDGAAGSDRIEAADGPLWDGDPGNGESIYCGTGGDEVFADDSDFTWACERVHRPKGDDPVTTPEPTTGGFWDASQVLTTHGGDAQLAVSSAGEAVSVWQDGDAVVARTRRLDGSLTAPQTVRESGARDVRLVAGRAGIAVAAWTVDSPPSAQVAEAAPGGGFGDALEIPGMHRVESLVVSHDGDVALVGITSSWQFVVSHRRSRGDWSPVEPATPPRPEGQAAVSSAALTNAGELVLAWMEQTWDPDDATPIRVATRRADGTFAAPVTLTGPLGSAGYPKVAVDGAGRAAVAFYDQTAGDRAPRIAYRTAAGAWGRAVDLPGVEPGTLAITEGGELLLAGGAGQHPVAVSGPLGGALTSHPLGELPQLTGWQGPTLKLAASASGRTLIGLEFSSNGEIGAHPLAAARAPAGAWLPWEDVNSACSLVDFLRLQLAVNDAGAAAALIQREHTLSLSVNAASAGPPVRGCTPEPPAPDWQWQQAQAWAHADGTEGRPRDALAPNAVPPPAMRVRRVRLAGTRRRPAARVQISCPAKCRVRARADLRTAKRSVMKGSRRLRLARGTRSFTVPLRGRRADAKRTLRLDVRVTATATHGRRWSGRLAKRVHLARR